MTVFVEEIAARDLTIADVTKWDTPAATACPNGDNATLANDTAGSAVFADSGGFFEIPWGTHDWTVELWVYYTANNGGANRWFCGLWGTGPKRAWEVRQPGDTGRHVRLALLGTDGETVLANVDINADLDAWTYCVFTLNASLGDNPIAGREILAYKNGTLASTLSIGSGADLTGPTLASRQFVLGDYAGQTVITIAEMAKLAIYHRLLSAGEVSDHYDEMTT